MTTIPIPEERRCKKCKVVFVSNPTAVPKCPRCGAVSMPKPQADA